MADSAAPRRQRTKAATRRDFLYLATGGVAAVGVAAVAWPFIDQMNPAADVLALSSTEVDIAKVEVGQRITVMWRGKPVFIATARRRRSRRPRTSTLAELRDPQTDAQRVAEDRNG